MMESQLLKLTKEVYFNRSGVLLLISSAVATGLAVIALRVSGAEQQVLIAISTSLFASTLFAFLQTMLTSLRYEALVAQSVEEGIQNATRRVLDDVTAHQREFVPSDVYPASTVPDRKFNRDLTHDLRATGRYFFRGVTGRYAIARLWLESRMFDEVHLLITNPLHARAMEPRVTHIVSYGPPGLAYQDVERRLLNEIYESLVSARLGAAKCRSLTLHFLSEPQVDRVELFDSSLYLTLYSDSTERGTNFPRTLRFDATSSMYKIYASQLLRSRDSAALSLVVKPGLSDDDLMVLLTKLGKTASIADLRSYENHFKSFAKQFANDTA